MSLQQEIEELERDIGIELPGEYAHWLNSGMFWNRKRSRLPIAPTRERPYWITLNPPYRIREPAESLTLSVEFMREIYAARKPGDGLIPDSAIEIASSETDERVLLFVKGPQAGQVWLKEWTTLEDTGRDDPDLDMTFIAGSFSEFLSVLLESEEP